MKNAISWNLNFIEVSVVWDEFFHHIHLLLIVVAHNNFNALNDYSILKISGLIDQDAEQVYIVTREIDDEGDLAVVHLGMIKNHNYHMFEWDSLAIFVTET